MKKIILYILGIVLSVFGSGMFVCCTYGAITDKFQPIHVSDYWKNQWRILWGDAGAGAFFIFSIAYILSKMICLRRYRFATEVMTGRHWGRKRTL